MVDVEAVVQQLLDAAHDQVPVDVTIDQHVRAERGKPEVTVHTCRSCTSTTPDSATIAAPTAETSVPDGAASISTSTGSFNRRQE